MNHKRLLLVSITSLTALLLLSAILVFLRPDTAHAAPTATTRYVSSTYGGDTTDCTNGNAPCKTIQYALAQSADGDTIYVHAGAYTETLQIDRSVTLQGGWGIWDSGWGLIWERSSGCHAESTVIDGQGAGRVIEIAANTAPVIDCFTITGGDATGRGGGPTGYDAGGGIYGQNAAPIIINNIISGNLASGSSTGIAYGGGIYLANAPATAVISNNVITHNIAATPTFGRGGGLYLMDSSVQVLSNTVERNLAGNDGGYGGGLAVRGGTPLIADNRLFHNTGALGGQGLGGGIYVWSSTPITIERSEIAYNTALVGSDLDEKPAQGGGIFCAGTPTVTAVIRDNLIHDNIASPLIPSQGEGGGMYLFGLSPASVVEGNRLWANYAGYNSAGRGGGIYVSGGDLTLAHNVLSGNIATWTGANGWGGGVYAEGGSLVLRSNVITANLGGGFSGFPSLSTGWGGGIAVSDTVATIVGNTIAGNVGTRGNSVGAGGGIYGYGGHLEIQGNLVADNRASLGTGGSGGGIYLQETVPLLDSNLVLRNAVTGTLARGGGVRIALCPVFTLTNNIIAENEASEQGSGFAVVLSEGVLAHNTIVQNDGGIGVGVEVQNGMVALTNTILVSHTVGITVTGDATATLDGTLWWANTTDWGGDGTILTGTVNLWGNPAFVRPSADNYHLRAGSAAIDSGVDTWVNTDMDGEFRPRGANPDLGADEHTCYARVGGVDYPSIQQAVNAAFPGQTVQVAEGVCYENVAIAKNLTLEGGWDETFTSRYTDPAAYTTIDGAGLGRVISITQASVTLDGLTLTGGDATGLGGSGSYDYDIGGGVYGWNSTVTVANCVVTDNVASRSTIGWGGGLGFYGGTVTLSNTHILSNVASTASNGYGGGVYFRYAHATVSGNTVEGNTASTGSNAGYGGGLYAREHSDLNVENVTLAGNTADNSGGGLYVLTSTVNLSGCTIYSNTAGAGGGVFLDDSDGAALTNNDVYSNTATYNGGGIYLWYSDDSMLRGNRVFGNRADQQDGGGVTIGFSSNGTMDRNEVFDNEAQYGAGWYLFYSDGVTLMENSVHDNEASESGGGIHILSSDDVTVEENDIASNRATGGAGVSLFGSSRALLAGNEVYDNMGGEGNSGIEVFSGNGITLRGNHIYGNSGGSIGGVWIQQSNNITLTANGIYSNTARDGGGLRLDDSDATLDNNVVADNQSANHGAGLYVEGSSLRLRHNTLARNTGGDGSGVYVTDAGGTYSTVALTDTILVSHAVGINVTAGSAATLEATLWGSGAWANGTDWGGDGAIVTGTVNIWGDPAFLNPAASNYHIRASSAAVNAGVDAGVTTDIDGDPRPLGSAPDIGADEVRAVYLPLILRND